MAAQWNENGNWLITGSRDHLVKLYDIRMMKEMMTFRGHKKEVTCKYSFSHILLIPTSISFQLSNGILSTKDCWSAAAPMEL